MSHPRFANINLPSQPRPYTFRSRVASSQFVSLDLSNRSSSLPQTCPLLLQLLPELCTVLSPGNSESSVPRAPGLFEGFTTFSKPITVLISERRHSQSASLPRRLPSHSKDNADLFRFAKYVDNNHQASAETSREALCRYFSSSDCPTMMTGHDLTEARVAAHEARAQAAIDAFDAAMEEQKR